MLSMTRQNVVAFFSRAYPEFHPSGEGINHHSQFALNLSYPESRRGSQRLRLETGGEMQVLR